MSELSTFKVLLSLEAHAIAQHRCKRHPSLQQARQVYLNTLAVYAVNIYLQCIGIETIEAMSDSHNQLITQFMDVADLDIQNLGKIECRPVLPGALTCHLPPEVRSNRLAYVFVHLNPTLKEAILLGYALNVTDEVGLDQLHPLSTLLEYLLAR